MRINVGCGRDIMEGWTNVDRVALPGVDHIMNFDEHLWPLEWHGKAKEIYMSHVLEHLRNPLFIMEQLWQLADKDCDLIIRVPYGSSDNAWEDPTHVRPYFVGSWAYFSQVYYKGADYGYRGDWDTIEVILDVYSDRCDSNEGSEVYKELKWKPNMVQEMRAILRPVKPIRDHTSEYNAVTKVSMNFV